MPSDFYLMMLHIVLHIICTGETPCSKFLNPYAEGDTNKETFPFYENHTDSRMMLRNISW